MASRRPRAPLVVAIDGAAGSGKSTLARGLARELGVPYVNTGLMYRALALEALARGVDASDGDALASLVGSLRFTLSATGNPRELEVDASPPGAKLWSGRVEAVVSEVSRHPKVRRRMVEIQRTLGSAGGVIEGRDIASVVFPGATTKFFLTAAPEVRASRRAQERATALTGVAESMRARDALDSGVSPHVPIPDAVVLDTTEAGVEEILERALRIVRTAEAAR
jgi:CMP/dCMP kinase